MIYFALGGIAVGALAGFIYWKRVSCSSGTCSTFSTKIGSMIYGAALGLFLSQQLYTWIN